MKLFLFYFSPFKFNEVCQNRKLIYIQYSLLTHKNVNIENRIIYIQARTQLMIKYIKKCFPCEKLHTFKEVNLRK